jgi:hypothetical protein
VLFLLNFAGQFEPEPKRCIVSLIFFSLFLIAVVFTNTTRIVSGRVSAGKFMFPQNVFDPIADRVLSHKSKQSLWMLTPNCNFQF